MSDQPYAVVVLSDYHEFVVYKRLFNNGYYEQVEATFKRWPDAEKFAKQLNEARLAK